MSKVAHLAAVGKRDEELRALADGEVGQLLAVDAEGSVVARESFRAHMDHESDRVDGVVGGVEAALLAELGG